MLAAAVYAIGGFIELLIAMRFVLQLLGANPASGFVEWVYSWSSPFVSPFADVFGQEVTIVPGAGAVATSVFDWAALIAFVVIGIIVALVGRLVSRVGR